MQAATEIRVVFEPQGEGSFHVYSPDVPGLHTQGETRADALENLAEALGLALESDDAPH